MDRTREISDGRESLPPGDEPLSDVEQTASKYGGWALELVRWYEADWKLAVMHGRAPKGTQVLEVIEPSRREIVKGLFDSIDSRFGLQEQTLALPAEGVPAGESPDEPELDATIDERPQSKSTEAAHSESRKDAALDPTLDQPAESVGGDGDTPGDEVVDETLDQAQQDNAGENPQPPVITVRSSGPSETLPTVPGYAIDRVLGRGGMGVVYLARQEKIDRLVALKMILENRHSSKRALDRFHAEARVIGRFQHENIVRIYDSGVHDGLPYFSLEFIDGSTLSDLIRRQPMDPHASAKLLIPIARALDYAHGEGIVHRDIKPSNILMTREQVPKISDFGLSKQLEEDNEISRTGDVVGTPSYMAPEQARGDSKVGPSTDIYAVGAMLYCMLTGRPPFNAASPTDTLIQVINREPVAPSNLQPTIDKDLETICLKCLQKSPEGRYETSGELADDLQRYVNGEPIIARPVSRTERAWRWAKRNPKLAVSAATAATLAVILSIGGPTAAGVIYGQKQEVESAWQVAEANAVAARLNAAEAQQNAVEAQQNAEEADKNAEAAATQEKLAIDALKRMANEVQKELRYVPNVQQTRMAILQTTRDSLKQMEQFGQDRTSHKQVDAVVQARRGDMNMMLGRVHEAQQCYARCLEILFQLEKEGGLKNRFHNLSTVHELLGDAARKAGQLNAARENWDQSLKIRREWVEAEPDDENVRQNLASTLGRIGWIARDQGDIEAARDYLNESMQIRKEYLDENPDSLDAQANFIGAQWSIAKLDFVEGKESDAQDELKSVIEALEPLLEKSPKPFQHRQNIGLAMMDLGDTQIYSGDYEAAEETYQDVVNRFRKLLEEDPDNHPLKARLGRALYRLSVAKKDDEKAATEIMQESMSVRKELFEGEPDNLSNQLNLLVSMARLGLLKEMADTLITAEKQIRQDAAAYYRLAGVYSLIAEALDRGAEPPAPIWTVAAAESLAVGAIKKATDLGFRRNGDLKQDPDLDFVRESDAFRELLASIE